VRRIVIGFLVAPFATPFAIWLSFSLLYILGVENFRGRSYGSVLTGTSVFSAYAIPLAAIVTLVGAVPTFYFLNRRQLIDLRHLFLAGIILGLLPFVLFFAWVALQEWWSSITFFGWSDPNFGIAATIRKQIGDLDTAAIWLILGATSGVSASVLFWVIAVRNNLYVQQTSNYPLQADGGRQVRD